MSRTLLDLAIRADARAEQMEMTAQELADLVADLLVGLIHAKWAYDETLRELWRERRLRERTEVRLRPFLDRPVQ